MFEPLGLGSPRSAVVSMHTLQAVDFGLELGNSRIAFRKWRLVSCDGRFAGGSLRRGFDKTDRRAVRLTRRDRGRRDATRLGHELVGADPEDVAGVRGEEAEIRQMDERAHRIDQQLMGRGAICTDCK